MFYLITYFLTSLFNFFDRPDERMDSSSSGSEDDVKLSSLKKGSFKKGHLKNDKPQLDAEFLRSTLDDFVIPILHVEVPNTSMNNVMSSPDSASACKRTDGDVPDETALSIVYGDLTRDRSHNETGSFYSDESDESANSFRGCEIKATKEKNLKEKAKQKRLDLKMKATKLREKQSLE